MPVILFFVLTFLSIPSISYASIFEDKKEAKELSDVPFLPVQIFKNHDLYSVDKKDLVTTMTSSGTSGQSVSRIFLDKRTAFNQSKVLSKIVTDFIGKKRLPFFVIDSPEVIKNRSNFSARGAGILGFSRFGSERTFLLDEKMNLDLDLLKKISAKYMNQPILFFGFTFMIWKHFLAQIESSGISFSFSNGSVIHGGGWKKLIDQAVSEDDFKKSFKKLLNIRNVYNYYGMVEQTGSIFFQCSEGHIHTSNFSEIIIRDPISFEVIDDGKVGLIQLISLLPQSYPGHSILSEDLGVIIGQDDCPCGRRGKYFEIRGRIKQAELRGCSDTYSDT